MSRSRRSSLLTAAAGVAAVQSVVLTAACGLLHGGRDGGAPGESGMTFRSAARGISVAYPAGSTVTITRGGRPAVTVPAGTSGQPGPEATSPAWSADGRHTAWSLSRPSRLVIADMATGRVDTLRCSCEGAAFIGDGLVTLASDRSGLLLVRIDTGTATKVAFHGALANRNGLTLSLHGAGRDAALIMAERGSKGWTFYRVTRSGDAERVSGRLPPWWPGEPQWDTGRGRAAFALKSNGGPCGQQDDTAVLSLRERSLKVIPLPPARTRGNIVDLRWGADGVLYASVTFWAPCSPHPEQATEPGRIWRLEGTSWRDTGRRLLAYQPITKDYYLGLRGSLTLPGAGGGFRRHSELVLGESASNRTQVIGPGALDFAVNPDPFLRGGLAASGEHAVPGRSRPPASTPVSTPPRRRTASGPMPVLGQVWGSDQEGYGQARPSKIFNGGDPTGLVEDVRWDSWGGPTATGRGIGIYAPGVVAEGTRRPARIVAFDLGSCHGVRAYRSVLWYFPQYGQRPHRSDALDICP